jgi:membrane protease YdiL (CAAX protease family)
VPLTAPARPRTRAGLEGAVAATAVTALVTLASVVLPERHVAPAVAALFLGATWMLVLRHDDDVVERAGLSMAGLMLPGPIDRARVIRCTLHAFGWAAGLAALTFVPFYFGWRAWWRPVGSFALAGAWVPLASQSMGQLFLVALPEEAFYRGYLQTRFDEALPSRVRILGGGMVPATIATSLVFALSHLATIHDAARLAVFFPSLLFGWLRARTGGVGAAILFHAFCNMFSEALGRGYGLY